MSNQDIIWIMEIALKKAKQSSVYWMHLLLVLLRTKSTDSMCAPKSFDFFSSRITTSVAIQYLKAGLNCERIHKDIQICFMHCQLSPSWHSDYSGSTTRVRFGKYLLTQNPRRRTKMIAKVPPEFWILVQS